MSVSQAIPQRVNPDTPCLSPGSKRDINIHYPESFSTQHRFSLQTSELSHNYRREHKRDLRKNRNQSRYRTQPITFDEIKEVDEENIEPMGVANQEQLGSLSNVRSAAEIRLDFIEFSKSLQESVNRKVSSTQAPCSITNQNT